jgi:hypothetical protein
MAAYTRKQYSGAARNTTTTTLLTNVGTTVDIAATTGWPSIAGIPFYIVINPSSIYEEKCLATISGSTLTLVRAQDDTTASEHQIGSVIYPVFTANDADEANELVSKLTTKGDLLVTDGTNLLRLGVGAEGYFLKASSSASAGVEWASIPTINSLNDIGDVTISDAEEGDFLVYKNSASAWINETIHFITVSDTEPTDEIKVGDLWYNSSELELYTYYSGSWIQLTLTPEFPKVEELDNVYADEANAGDVLAFDGLDWYSDTVSNLLGSQVIALSGDVSGSVLFDGSASVNISTTIQSNSVALGADTTGSYVQSLVAGTGVTLSNNSGESATPTIAIGQAVGTTASVSFAHVATDSLNITNNVVGGGNITLSPNVSSYAIGDTGPAGGKIFITPSTSGNTTGKYFEAAPVASQVLRKWATDTDPGIGLGNAETAVVGADGTAIGTGQQNTADIVAQVGNVAATSAAVYCDEYAYGGFSDWFLPSKDELNELYLNQIIIGGFLSSYYSSSSEFSNDAFWFQSFIDGISNVPYKNNAYYIRPVRSFVAPAPAGIITGNLTGNVTGDVTGNASTATTLETARTISLSGDVSGSVSFDGSTNATISTTIQPNSVALGTDTTGNYMSDLTQGTGITITHTPGEGSNATIAIGQAVATSSSVSFARLETSDDVVVGGNLTVNGTTTTLNTETLLVEDNIVVLNSGITGSPTLNSGIEVERGSSTNVALRWNESSDKWETTNDGSTYSVIATNGNIALGTDTTGNSDNVTEGTTNLYFTDARARTALLADNAGTASGIRFIAPNTGTVELISHEATRFVRVTSNAAVGGGKTEIQGSAEILASSSISDPGHLTVAGSVTVGGGVIFEGDTANDYETTLVATDPTADRTITLPNATTTLVGTDTTQTLSNKTLTTPTINGPEITATGGTPRIHGIYLPEPHFITFEGSTTNEFETVLTVVDPTADRTVSLPDASGTVALSGSIALGTDTTGNYMSDLTQGTGVTITHTPGEGSNATIAIGQDVTASASVTFANVTATSNVSISGRIDKTTIRESVADASVSASVVTADYATGDIFYLGTAPGSNFTVNLTNAPTDNGKAITVVIFVTQGATGYIPNAVQVAGSAQTIKWANGAAPTPTSSAGKIDIFSFTFVRRSSAWTVFGSSNLGY